jgi:leucyl aminopeptidase
VTSTAPELPELPTPLPSVTAVTTPSGGQPVVTVDSELEFGPGAGEADPAAQLPSLGVTGKAGELTRLPTVWLVGVGAGEPADYAAAGASLARALRSDDEQAPHAANLAVGELRDPALRALVLGLRLGSYRFRVSAQQASPAASVELVVADVQAARPQVELAAELAAATGLTRDLANTPSNVKTPQWLADIATALAAAVPGVGTQEWDAERLAAEGFGGVLAVGGGSASPPRMLRLDWAPDGARAHVALVGKGITFDTGGISIKPADGMHLMRTDMAGGAAVIAALLTIARLRLPVRVTALVPMAENHVSGSAYRPGDVVTHYDGRTTEVTNTDAEGRMVLADALGYAVRELAPDAIVDVATLTGAMKVSLGLRTGGLLASDDALADAVIAAGERAGERLWRMPLLAHVAEDVESEIADVRQIPPGPGGIGAALFLREFTGGLPWAHLDIAGPARADRNYAEVVEGATGFAARTLVELVRLWAPNSSTDTTPHTQLR